jgi:GPI mannosyltransferase 3
MQSISAARLIPAALVVAGAVVLRVWAATPLSLLYPDEIGQYLEQAHRLVSGYGIVPW